MGRYFVLCITSLFLFNCASEPTLEFARQTIASNDITACNNKKCPEITVDFEALNPTHPLADAINKENEKFVAAIISSAVMPDEYAVTVNEAVDSFVINFQDYMGDFPQAVEMYELDIQNFVAFSDDQYISFETDFYTYTGGAHGYSGQEYLVLDAQTGAQLLLDEIVKDEAAFTKFAEMEFRKQNEIPISENINSTGFWFDEDEFYLSETYGFSQDGFEVIYQVYDISSYADGPVTLSFTWDQIKPYLK
ncbi:MAG: DUF3298 domain-containing protein [Gilvibacter sp.]